MNTPICDFIKAYAEKNAHRLHMPGHKGQGEAERMDITEIAGADSLYAPSGIIAESEANASRVFGTRTLYGTEGASQCIRAMVCLAVLYAKEKGVPPKILAGRNAHQSFVSAAALSGCGVDFCMGMGESYMTCTLSPSEIEAALCREKYTAVYLTSPDYLGNMADISGIAAVCKRHGVLLLVDNAHGAYLHFLPESRHPIDLGADICCDSAHKTLPVLTGGAYLHLGKTLLPSVAEAARRAMALFGSTSPSYLILQSLDSVNTYLTDGYRETLAAFIQKTDQCKKTLEAAGWQLVGEEPLKISLQTKPYGTRGTALAAYLEEKNIFCEMADPDFLVCMVTPQTGAEGLAALAEALLSLPKRPPIWEAAPIPMRPEPSMELRTATFAPAERCPAGACVGRILAESSTGMPPCVPIAIAGERLTEEAVSALLYYGIQECTVVKEGSELHL